MKGKKEMQKDTAKGGTCLELWCVDDRNSSHPPKVRFQSAKVVVDSERVCLSIPPLVGLHDSVVGTISI
jgi:hypothetical protein